MRVAFDSQIFSLQARGGISRYFVALGRQLAKLDCEAQLLSFLITNHHLLEAGAGPLTAVNWNVIHSRLPANRMIDDAVRVVNACLCRAWLSARRPDVVHETYFYGRWAQPRGCRTVVTVFDMISELYPGFPESESLAKRRAVGRADHVICISENTRRDLLRLFDVHPDKVSAIPLGVDSPLASPTRSAAGRPYLLYVGQRGLYKNFNRLLEAYAASARLRRDLDLVCFGGGPWCPAELANFRTLGLSPSAVRWECGDDRTLSRAYYGAQLFVYPSLYEGFGLPPLEAMAHSCPVACSETSSLPEVVGDAASAFDPTDPEAIRVAIEAVAYNEGLRQDLVKRGLARAALFRWEHCAAETLAVYRALL